MQLLVASFVILIISIINFTKPRDEDENRSRSQTDPTRPLSSYQIMQCRCLHLATKRFLLSSILGGVTAEALAAIALIGCSALALIGFPAHPGLFVSAALAFSS